MGFDPIGMGDMGENPPTSTLKERVLSLLKKHSFNRGEFTLASGRKSLFFFDCKKTLLLNEGNILASEIILKHISALINLNIRVDCVAGVELGGCPLATGVSIASVTSPITSVPRLDSLYIRKTAKDHGTKNLIEGFSEGKNVVLLEDVITTGMSSMNALAALKSAGYNPVAVIAIIDRLEGGSDDIRKQYGIPVNTIYTIEDFT